MTNNRLDDWNARLSDATAVVDAIQYAKTCGLEVEFTMTFLDHHETNQYTVAECIFHSLREWDL
jgi:hypothetical protein